MKSNHQKPSGLRFSVAVLALFLGDLAFASESCKGSKVSFGERALVTAQGSLAHRTASDRRVTIGEVASRPQLLTPSERQLALAASRTAVRIRKFGPDGRTLANGWGTGFFYKGSSCYILTVQHNVVPGTTKKSDDGTVRFIPDLNHNPKGERVDVLAGFSPGGTPQKLSGTVVAVGLFVTGINGDHALIRLDRPFVSNARLDATSANPQVIAQLDLMSAGFAWNMQHDVNNPVLSIDPKCNVKAVNLRNGIETDCLVAPGDSGGLAIDKGSNAIVGMWILRKKIDSTSTGTNEGLPRTNSMQQTDQPGGVGYGRFISLSEIENSVMFGIEQDQRRADNPCKEDLQF